MRFQIRPIVGAANLALGVERGVHHLGDTVAVHGSEHGGEADAADAAEDDVEGHVDLGVLAPELFRGHVDAAARRNDDAHGLVHHIDALEDVDHGRVVCGGDAQDVDRVHQAVHHAVAALHADDYLTARGREGVVADGRREGVCIGVGGVVAVVFGGGEGVASLAEAGEGDEGACGWEPLAGLEQDIGSIGWLEGEGQAGHGEEVELEDRIRSVLGLGF